jgi:hypothetical protein
MAELSDAEFAAKLRGLSQTERDKGELMLSNKKVRSLVLLALSTPFENEASVALGKARQLYRK